MVTQKIVTRLSNDVLPPVRMVSGDVGREIQLEIYASDDSENPIDLETYYASITIIKPDNTFVIKDFDSDKVELPEQAGAVTGHGYYQIKIYTAGDHQIYTGQGPFIVDDDILSEEMIESVAEVNGYKFPDDFLTDADLREYVTKYELEDALAGIIDDDTTDYNSTWSSYKINEALSNVGTSYSTEEKIVGKWIDGTTDVYEKTFVIEPASPPMDWVGFFTVNMAALVSVEGHTVYNASGQTAYTTIYDDYYGCRFSFNPAIARGQLCYYYSNSDITKIIVTVRYTKGV